MTMIRPRLLTALIVSVLMGLIAGASVALSDEAGAPIFLQALILAVTLSAASAYCVVAWRKIDEAAREAHKSSWWWGGTGGLIFAALFMPALMQGSDLGLGRLAVGESPGSLILVGALAVLLCQTAGYFVAWGIWWLRKR